MRKYLSTLHQRSSRHKKHFSLLVSGGVTLAIFAVWSLVTFGTGGTLAQNNAEAEHTSKEVSPLESVRTSLSSSMEGLKEVLGSLKSGLGEAVDLEADYTEMKTDVLNTYAQ